MTLRTRAVLVGSLALGALFALQPPSLRAGDYAAPPFPPPAPPPPASPTAPEAAPAPAPAPARLRTAAELRELVGPVALYPDVVLSSLLPASAYPLDVVRAARWLSQRTSSDATPPADAGWDRSVVALCQFPEVVLWLNDNLEWLEQLGAAVAAQQPDVLEAIQQFRAQARAAGSLETNDYQKVKEESLPPPESAPAGTEPAQVISIEPAQPSVVYVPVYDPVIVLEPVVVPVISWSLCWSFGAYGPWAWHDLAWGWPCGSSWWGCGVYVYSTPWYACAPPRQHFFVSGAYGPARWSAPYGGYGGHYYSRYAQTGGVVMPHSPSWADRSRVRSGIGGGVVVRSAGGLRTPPDRWVSGSPAGGGLALPRTPAPSDPLATTTGTTAGGDPALGKTFGSRRRDGGADASWSKGPRTAWGRWGDRTVSDGTTVTKSATAPTATTPTTTAPTAGFPAWSRRTTWGFGSGATTSSGSTGSSSLPAVGGNGRRTWFGSRDTQGPASTPTTSSPAPTSVPTTTPSSRGFPSFNWGGATRFRSDAASTHAFGGQAPVVIPSHESAPAFGTQFRTTSKGPSDEGASSWARSTPRFERPAFTPAWGRDASRWMNGSDTPAPPSSKRHR